ncbi:NADP-dependent oxidoreductase [Nocardia sp. NPDC052112]|uniref:NADP-dependent oxidoreductase n=1 Tax=Nocardia sp. NPDC052112 TaxID=3155646 RepID=UPI00341D50F5
MMVGKNRAWLLTTRPTGLVGREHFQWHEDPLPAIRPGEFLIRNQWLSCDAAQRAWMQFDTYIPALPLGTVMASGAIGEVVTSKHPGFAPGDLVYGVFGWQDYAVSDGSPFGGLVPPQKLPPGTDAITAMSLFGIGALTAYFGLLDIGRPQPGETVVVSAAAGAVGSIVCQIAKIHGCRVIGIAGGTQKCAWLRDVLGTDDAIDYKNEDLAVRLAQTCPDGIDVFYDNVGGAALDAALANLADEARIVLCGAVSGYCVTPPEVTNLINLIIRRATMRGFLVFDYLDRSPTAIKALAGWATEGKLINQVDIIEGLEHAPDALRRLFTGDNLGRQLVKIAD